MSKVLNTHTLIRLNREARKKFNRTLSPEVMAMLDPNGFHVVADHFMHGDVQCIRCHMFLKLVDMENPAEATLDIDFDEFNKLPDSKDLAELN